MSCIQNLFRCNFNDNSNTSQETDNWFKKEIEFLRNKLIDCELDLKTFKSSHELELRRLDEKIMTQIQILTNKLDATLCASIIK